MSKVCECNKSAARYANSDFLYRSQAFFLILILTNLYESDKNTTSSISWLVGFVVLSIADNQLNAL